MTALLPVSQRGTVTSIQGMGSLSEMGSFLTLPSKPWSPAPGSASVQCWMSLRLGEASLPELGALTLVMVSVLCWLKTQRFRPLAV